MQVNTRQERFKTWMRMDNTQINKFRIVFKEVEGLIISFKPIRMSNLFGNKYSSLVQGSHFDERVFLSRKPERTLVRQLLTEEIQTDDFVYSDILQSDNGRLLIPLVNRLQENWPDEFPEVYKRYYIRIIVVF